MKDSPQQRGLLLSRKDRLAALARLDPADAGIGDRQWPAVVDLLTQIELRTGRGGCHSYAGTLYGAMRNGVGVSEATFHRARRAAQAAGLLATQHRRDEHRQASNVWTIDWSRVAMLAGAAKESDGASDAQAEQPEALQGVTCADQGVTSRPASTSATPTSDRPGRRNDTPGCHHDTPNKGLAIPSVSSSSGRLSTKEFAGDCDSPSGDDARAPSALPRPCPASRMIPPPAPHVAEKFLRSVGGKFSPRDAALAWKLAAVSSVLGEAWLWGIAEAVRSIGPTKPWAYVWRCAAEGSHERPGPGEGRLRRLLVRCSEPPPGWPLRRDGPDFSKRLCVANHED